MFSLLSKPYLYNPVARLMLGIEPANKKRFLRAQHRVAETRILFALIIPIVYFLVVGGNFNRFGTFYHDLGTAVLFSLSLSGIFIVVSQVCEQDRMISLEWSRENLYMAGITGGDYALGRYVVALLRITALALIGIPIAAGLGVKIAMFDNSLFSFMSMIFAAVLISAFLACLVFLDISLRIRGFELWSRALIVLSFAIPYTLIGFLAFGFPAAIMLLPFTLTIRIIVLGDLCQSSIRCLDVPSERFSLPAEKGN